MELEGKVAIVTGGAVRLGKAQALALAEAGARVLIHYGSSEGPAQETVAEIEDLGSEAVAIQGDFRNVSGVRSMMEDAVEAFGQIDILVNSAAIFEAKGWQDTTEGIWDRHFAINLKAPFFLSQAFAKHVGEDRRGHIVNIADWRGVRPGTDHFAYTLTKAGLIAMTKSLALGMAPTIQVNAIAPGFILPPPAAGEGFKEDKVKQVPIGRRGYPSDITETLLFLLRSDFVTGELVFVTGGEHL